MKILKINLTDMEINNKYNLNDVVYFMEDNKIQHGYVYRFKVEVKTRWETQIQNFRDKPDIEICYRICTDGQRHLISKDFICENLLFDSKEALLNTL